jgi:hypothetical protein
VHPRYLDCLINRSLPPEFEMAQKPGSSPLSEYPPRNWKTGGFIALYPPKPSRETAAYPVRPHHDSTTTEPGRQRTKSSSSQSSKVIPEKRTSTRGRLLSHLHFHVRHDLHERLSSRKGFSTSDYNNLSRSVYSDEHVVCVVDLEGISRS